MTVIAWDGKTLAADRRIVFGSTIRTMTKIRRVNGCLVGSSGDADSGAEMVEWFASGADHEKFKDRGENWGGLLVILPSGEIHKYQRTPYPIKMPNQNFAIGSGCEYALAAMYLGKTAYEAVEVACTLDASCGNGIDTITFDEKKPNRSDLSVFSQSSGSFGDAAEWIVKQLEKGTR